MLFLACFLAFLPATNVSASTPVFNEKPSHDKMNSETVEKLSSRQIEIIKDITEGDIKEVRRRNLRYRSLTQNAR